MKTFSNTVFLLLFYLPVIAFAQKKGSDTDKKFAVGFGYNFLNVLNEDMKFRPFEVSAKYAITKKHLVYLSVPFRTSDLNSDTHSSGPSSTYYSTNSTHRGLWGIGTGYNYNCVSYAHFTAFAGVGFEFLRRKEDAKQYSIFTQNGVDDETNAILIYVKKAYAFVPQVGLKYNWKFLEAELKYKFHISKARTTGTWDIFGTEGSSGDPLIFPPDEKTIYYHGLSISLYYLL